ncbi:MAG: ABC transporter ATP-binding protein [Planctomycetes bacterium]|nr:ABC transporter ATP-binding protein [Planctomycetota bacterium]
MPEFDDSANGRPPAIRLEKVSKIFRDFWGRRRLEAVKALSLEIPNGEIFGLLGPNGSGKTTTLLMILGLLRPSSGEIRVLGKPPGEKSLRARIGYLPEEFSPPEMLTGEEILSYYGGFFPLARPLLKSRIAGLLETLDLAADGRRRFREYSKGMRRRIGLAQALLHGPQLLVLDEPTNGLDPIGVQKVKALLLDLRREGRTVLISSHMLPELEEMCDRIAILNRGECIGAGLTRELLSSKSRQHVLLDNAGPERAQAAAELLRQAGYEVGGIQPAKRSLESLFLAALKEPGNPDGGVAEGGGKTTP